MERLSRLLIVFVALVLVASTILAACGATAVPTVAPTTAPTAAPATAPSTAPTAAPTAAPTTPPQPTTPPPPTATYGPAVGGSLVYGVDVEPPTLDVQKNILIITGLIAMHMSGTILGRDPSTGQFTPYVAESWKASADALTWDFTVRKGITFHDGTPLTAKDVVWTYQRAMDPNTKNPQSYWKSVKSVDLLDEYTFRVTLTQPFAPLLHAMTTASFAPISPSAVQKEGDNYGRAPVMAGPFKFKEWQTGQKIVLERNSDYNWAPPFAHQGPPYLQTVEFRIIPEYSTIVAGLEAGEIDIAGLQSKDVARFQTMTQFALYEGLNQGMNPVLLMNLKAPPFDDLKVRQAFNYAADRQMLIKAVAQGLAVEMHGPMAPSQPGYWPGIEDYGYGYDLDKAKALMAEAGYTPGPDGMLQKNGQPLKVNMKIMNYNAQVGQMLQQQYKALGVDIQLEEVEQNLVMGIYVGGQYQCGLFGISSAEPDLMYGVLHTKQIGALNFSQISDPELDKLLEAQRAATTWDARAEALKQVQKAVVDRAIFVPLYTPKTYFAVSKELKGTVYCGTYCPNQGLIYLADAYFEK
jgi:peptide/nickel transport system substrate-binding protein